MLDRFGGPIEPAATDYEDELSKGTEAEHVTKSPCMADSEEILVAILAEMDQNGTCVEKQTANGDENIEKFGDNVSSLLPTSCCSDFVSVIEENTAESVEVNNVFETEENADMPLNWIALSKPAMTEEDCENFSHRTDERVRRCQTVISKSHRVHKMFTHSHLSGGLVSKKKQQKYLKAWKFKFKPKTYQVLTDLLQPYCAQQRVTQKTRGVTSRYQQRKFCKEWKFKYKSRFLQQFLTHREQLVVMERSDITYTSSFMILQGNVAVLMKSFQGSKRRFRKEYSSIWHRWRYKTWECSSVLIMITRQMRTLWLSESLQAWSQFLVGDGLFHVKHKWRFKKIPSVSGSSLWASLISREGVCKSILTWLRKLNVLIEWFSTASECDVFNKYVMKQKQMTEQSILWKIQEVNYHLLKERRFILLMLIKRHRLQVLIQQRQKWKRWYKTWMFKYKARLKQVQVLPLHVVFSPWRSSCFVWHRWRSKESGRRIERDMLERLRHIDSGATCRLMSAKGWLLFFPSKLVGKLVFMGEVLIDFYYLSLTWQCELMTWLRQKSKAKLPIVSEGMLLQSSEATYEYKERRDDDERLYAYDVDVIQAL
ncbi:hypothetical protein Bca101_019296 [Brassica carinata]